MGTKRVTAQHQARGTRENRVGGFSAPVLYILTPMMVGLKDLVTALDISWASHAWSPTPRNR